ncbi:alpha subunit of the translation initiation factor eIF2B [Nadsonia fulvescens var. elongata DSM 6958]|uniref:Translation initiation factor eIF2B subunit alpha n=1 Tax=Nadsonia fulvescens var. elongata DSM 6958 TaxID=857566 RepID=A0A1E3PLN0_9ASCO|nr:alpha subunit of the translation initiation factor eIF2B [Nadsonia fulvescens var. elongata DSM 6958]
MASEQPATSQPSSSASSIMEVSESFDIKATYLKFLEDDKEMTMPVAAIETLVTLLGITQPSTSYELIKILENATQSLKKSVKNSISLSAGCDLFMRFVLRNIHKYGDWDSCKRHLVANGRLFVERAKTAREHIAENGLPFIRDDDVILVLSYSRTLHSLLLNASKKRIRFRVIVTESRPSNKGSLMAKVLREAGIPVSLVVDGMMGYVIDKVDKVFCGAEGVAESGGVINHIGTYQLAVLARNANKPLYVVAESHKFVRLFPLSPSDLPTEFPVQFSITEPEYELERSPRVDFTPHQYITALITDLGVLTPSGVSEELIKMWYD